MELPAGFTLGAFQVLEKIGQGAMGTVYRARQPALERDVALKILNASHEPEAFARLHDEAIRVAQLRHPSILPVFDFGQQDDIAYIAMQLADGGTLAARTHDPMPPAEAIQLLKPVAQAIDYAHGAGIIHRDVKPGNMLFDEGRIFLSDFGLALIRDAATTTGQMVGTPWYMAPEQFRGKAEASSDIYALAVTLFQLLTGHVPYDRDSTLAVMLAHLKDPIPSAREWNPDIPEGVDRVLRRGMAKDPESRFPRAIDLLAAVHAVQREPAASKPVGKTSSSPAPSPQKLAAAAAARAAATASQRQSVAVTSADSASQSVRTIAIPVAAEPKPTAPALGRAIFESLPDLGWAKANIVLRDPRVDRIKLSGELLEVDLSPRGQAQVLLPIGSVDDFMAQLQFGIVPGSGIFELMFHEGSSEVAHCVRLEPQRGQVSVGIVKATGEGGERWFAARTVAMDPKLQHKLLVVANKGAIEAFIDGHGVVAAKDQTLAKGVVRLQMLPAAGKPTSVLLLNRISAYRLPA